MNQTPYLNISVGDESVTLQYVVQNNILVNHTHDFGIKHLESKAMSKEALSNFFDGIFYALECISLYDRIPTEFKLQTSRYGTWLKSAIESKSYSQFYTGGIPVRVTLENNKDTSFSYARHKKAVLSFKI